MALSNIVYPITESSGIFSDNVFPSQKRLLFTATRIDQPIASITSGTGGVVRINTSSTLTDVGLGDYVSFGTDAYTARTSLVINVVDPSTIEVDEVFISTNVTNGFINYKKDFFLEVRYVDGDATTDDQSAIEVLRDYTQVPSNVSGEIEANISVPSSQITPEVPTTTSQVSSLSVKYKIQYRESWKDNRAETWVSPSVDAPILLVHAANSASLGFTDLDLTKMYTRDYPIYYSYVYSDINDSSGNDVTIKLKQYDITKTLLQETDESIISNANGVIMIVVTPDKILSSTVFVEFDTLIVSSSGQYDPAQYDPAQYA